MLGIFSTASSSYSPVRLGVRHASPYFRRRYSSGGLGTRKRSPKNVISFGCLSNRSGISCFGYTTTVSFSLT